jgi:hypothetical protein
MCIKYTLQNSIKITRRPVTKNSRETYDYEGHAYTLDKIIVLIENTYLFEWIKWNETIYKIDRNYVNIFGVDIDIDGYW